MSAGVAHAAPARRRQQDEYRRHIEIVTSRAQRRARPRLAYAIVGVAGLFAIFLGQLLLSIALSDGAYDLSKLVVEERELSRTQQSLVEQLELMGSSQNLAANAQSLGMVNSATPVYLRLSDGAVFGSVQAADAATAAGSGFVPNSLLAGVELVDRSFTGDGQSGPGAPTTPAAVTPTPGSIPSPVTR